MTFVPRDARALACDAADGGATTVGTSQRKLRARVRVACVRVCMRVSACGCLTHQHKPRVRVCMRVCVSGHARVCVRGCLAHQRKLPARAAREGAHAPLRAPAAGPHALLHDLRLVRVVMSVSMIHGMVTTACSSTRPAAGARCHERQHDTWNGHDRMLFCTTCGWCVLRAVSVGCHERHHGTWNMERSRPHALRHTTVRAVPDIIGILFVVARRRAYDGVPRAAARWRVSRRRAVGAGRARAAARARRTRPLSRFVSAAR